MEWEVIALEDFNVMDNLSYRGTNLGLLKRGIECTRVFFFLPTIINKSTYDVNMGKESILTSKFYHNFVT